MRLGIDIGGTKTEAVVVDQQGTVLHRVRVPTGYGSKGVIDSTHDAIIEALTAANLSVDGISAAGVGVPGRVDRSTGVVVNAVNLGCETLEIGKGISDRFGFAVYVDNDVNAAALGAWHQREIGTDALGIESMAYLNLGTGLAAGIVLSGRLWRGARGTAGEIGHISVDPSGPVCVCGQRGCLEAVASGSALSRQWPSTGPDLLQKLYSAVTEGDRVATQVWTRFLGNVASAVRVLMLTVDVEVIFIGGGVASVGTPLLDGVREALVEQAMLSPFLSFLQLADRLQLASSTGLGAIGAAMLAAPSGERALEATY